MLSGPQDHAPSAHLVTNDDVPPNAFEGRVRTLEIPDVPQTGDPATHRSVYEVSINHVTNLPVEVLRGVELCFPEAADRPFIHANALTGETCWPERRGPGGWRIGHVVCQSKQNGCTIKVRDASHEAELDALRADEYAAYLEMWRALVRRVREEGLELGGVDFASELEARVDWDPRVLEELHETLLQHIVQALGDDEDAAVALHEKYPVMELTKRMHTVNERLRVLHEREAEEVHVTSSVTLFFVVDWYDSDVAEGPPSFVRMRGGLDVHDDSLPVKVYSTEKAFRAATRAREQMIAERSFLGRDTTEESQEERVRALWYVSQPQVLLASALSDARGAFQAHFVVAPRHQNAVPAPDTFVELTTPAGAHVRVRFDVHNILRRFGFLDVDKPDFEQAHREYILRSPESWKRYLAGVARRLRGFDFEPTVLEGADAWEVRAMAYAGLAVCNLEALQDTSPSTKPDAVHDELFSDSQRPLDNKYLGVFFTHLHLMFVVTPK